MYIDIMLTQTHNAHITPPVNDVSTGNIIKGVNFGILTQKYTRNAIAFTPNANRPFSCDAVLLVAAFRIYT